MSPNLGISYDPSSRWHLTGTVHAPEKVDLDVGFSFLLPTGLQQSSNFTLLYDYMPWQLGASLKGGWIASALSGLPGTISPVALDM